MLKESEVKEIQKAVYKLIQDGAFEQALDLLQTLLEHDPNDAISLNFLGLIHLEMNNNHLAYQYLRRAIQENPKIAPMWVNFGLAAHELGRNEEALNSYIQASKIDEEYSKNCGGQSTNGTYRKVNFSH